MATQNNHSAPLEALTRGAALGPMGLFGPAFATGVSRFSGEMAQFVAGRIAKDMAAQRALMACRTLGEVQRVQAEFVQSAVEDYTVEMPRMMALGLSMMTPQPEDAKGGLSEPHADDHMGV